MKHEDLNIKQLKKALTNNELSLHYQPIVDLRSGQITGAEALIRWEHPRLGMIPPVQFIPLSELTGLIKPITKWVIDEACKQNMVWQEAGLPRLRVAVNFPGNHITEKRFVKSIAKSLQKSQLSPRLLEIEITETQLMKNVTATIDTLNVLNKMGVHISIDDFGTGYSSLNYLRDFKATALKIDGSFLKDISPNSVDSIIVTAIISLSEKLNLRVAAECIETNEQLRFLQKANCNEGQGYIFSAPLTAEDFRRKFPAMQKRIVRLVTNTP